MTSGTSDHNFYGSAIFNGDGTYLTKAQFYIGNHLYYQWVHNAYSGFLKGCLVSGVGTSVLQNSTTIIDMSSDVSFSGGDEYPAYYIGGMVLITFYFDGTYQLQNGVDYRVGFGLITSLNVEFVIGVTAGNIGLGGFWNDMVISYPSSGGNLITYVYSTSGTSPTPTPTGYVPTPTPPTPLTTPRAIEVSNEPVTLYFRSDIYSTVGISGYGLDVDHTNTAAVVADNMATVGFVVYGFRVYLVTSSISERELSSGTPVAQITLSSNQTGLLNANWNVPATNVILGYQALKVTVYMNYAGSGWIARATYLSGVLITGHIVATTWTFRLNVNYTVTNTDTYSTFRWDSSAYRSGIYNVIFTKPLESEVQMWRINRGDYVGFELGAYIDVIGEAFYVILLLLFAGTLYFRYGHFGVITVFFTIFGGVGGLVWFLVPPWAAAAVSAIVIIGTSFVVWRVIR